jgi:hypothetical protein
MKAQDKQNKQANGAIFVFIRIAAIIAAIARSFHLRPCQFDERRPGCVYCLTISSSIVSLTSSPTTIAGKLLPIP